MGVAINWQRPFFNKQLYFFHFEHSKKFFAGVFCLRHRPAPANLYFSGSTISEMPFPAGTMG